MTASSHRRRQAGAKCRLTCFRKLVLVKSRLRAFFPDVGTVLHHEDAAGQNTSQWCRMRSKNERRDRLAMQDSLQAVVPPCCANETSLARRIFTHAK